MAFNSSRLNAQSAAEKAVSVIGSGYDLTSDIRLSACKPTLNGSTLIEIDLTRNRDLVFPGGIVVKSVSSSIKCDKGGHTRLSSDTLSFDQMSEKFNQDMSLSGKIRSGMFNDTFRLTEGWDRYSSSVKALAYDGCFISLYSVEILRSHVTLRDEVKREVPSSLDSPALARSIEKFGTHIVVGVTIGGKDVVYMKQMCNSNHEHDEVQMLLKQVADKRFSVDPVESISPTAVYSANLGEESPIQWGFNGPFGSAVSCPVTLRSKKNKDLVSICIRRGGVDTGQSHDQWLSTVSQSPNAISMCFIPIISLLSGLPGTEFLSYAVNLYLQYKPPIENLQQFLEFQIPHQWAWVNGDLPLGLSCRKQSSPSLQFSLMGLKLYVNTSDADSGGRPVTGLRLFLEGKKGEHLAIHLHHLSSCPPTLHLSHDETYEPIDEPSEEGVYEAVKCWIFSHVCTFPVEYNGAWSDKVASIVTKAWLEVKGTGMRKVLLLRLGFSLVASAITGSCGWYNHLSSISQKYINSAVYPKGPSPKLVILVDMKEVVRVPEVPPGCWVVTGARLCVEAGKISIMAKFSMLTVVSLV